MSDKNCHSNQYDPFPALISVIRGEFQMTDTLTVRQIRALSPEFANATLVRKGFKALIADNLCAMEGSKRGSRYVRKDNPSIVGLTTNQQ